MKKQKAMALLLTAAVMVIGATGCKGGSKAETEGEVTQAQGAPEGGVSTIVMELMNDPSSCNLSCILQICQLQTLTKP